MVWYPIDFCYRMGVTSESIIFISASSSGLASLGGSCPSLLLVIAVKEDLDILISRDSLLSDPLGLQARL
jgi:hypothetical protein